MSQILAYIFLQLHHYQCNQVAPYHKMKDPTPQNDPQKHQRAKERRKTARKHTGKKYSNYNTVSA